MLCCLLQGECTYRLESCDLYNMHRWLCACLHKECSGWDWDGVQVGLLVIEAGFLFAQSFFVLMLLFAIGELALFAGQAPCSERSAT